MKWVLAGFVLCLFFIPSLVSATDWYVRPAGGSYGSENGVDYNNAWNGLSNVVWGAGGVVAGDTLYICGLHHRTFNGYSLWEQIDMNEVSGSQNSPITIRGDCPGDQGIVWGAGVLAHESWVNEGSNTYSITIPSSMYSGWLFEDVNATSWKVLDMENTLQDCMNNPGSYYSANYQTGTKLYVHTSDDTIPTNRISFPRAGYMFIADNCEYIEWKNLKTYYLYRMFFDWTLDHNVRYMTWDNVTMWYGEGAIQEWRSSNTHHFTVKNSDIAWAQNGLITGPKTGGLSTDCSHNYNFTGNYIHDIGVRVTHPDAHCIGIQGGYNEVIEKNTCVNCGTGPLLYANGPVQSIKDTIIRWNFVKDCHTLGSAAGYGISFMLDGQNLADKSGSQVYGNIVTNCTDAYRYKWEYQTVFYNNIAHDCDKSFRIYRGQSDTVAPNIKIRNHISLNPKTYHIEFYSPLSEGNYVIDSDYNLFYPISGNQFSFYEEGAGGGALNFAGWQALSKTGCTFDPNSIVADPMFVSANPQVPADFKLQSNSPAIDNGTFVGLTMDYEGNPIPMGNGTDIGAYEYDSGSPPPPCNDNCLPNPCSYYTDCTAASGWCSGGGYCCSGTCTPPPTCSSLGGTCCQTGETCSGSSQTTIDCTTCCTSGVCQPPPPSPCPDIILLHHYDNDPNYGESPTNVYDFSKHGNNGSCSGTNCPTWTSGGNFSGAFDYDGLNDYFRVTHSPSLNLNPDNFSISFWINYRDYSTLTYVTTKFGAGGAYFIRGGNGGLSFFVMGGGVFNETYINSGVLQLNTWHHVVATKNSTEMSIYVDGKLNSSQATIQQLGMSTADITIGTRWTAAEGWFNGLIDELTIWNRTLSSQEIQNLFTSGNPVPCQSIPGDLDNDGDVDIFDLQIVTGSFGLTSGYDPRADTIPTSEIDIFDVVFVASRFTS